MRRAHKRQAIALNQALRDGRRVFSGIGWLRRDGVHSFRIGAFRLHVLGVRRTLRQTPTRIGNRGVDELVQVFAHHVGFKLVFFLYEPLVVLHARHIGRHVLPRRSYLSYRLAHLRQNDNINRHSDREKNNRIHHRGRKSITNDALHKNARLFGHMHFRRLVPFACGSRMFGLVGTGLVF